MLKIWPISNNFGIFSYTITQSFMPHESFFKNSIFFFFGKSIDHTRAKNDATTTANAKHSKLRH